MHTVPLCAAAAGKNGAPFVAGAADFIAGQKLIITSLGSTLGANGKITIAFWMKSSATVGEGLGTLGNGVSIGSYYDPSSGGVVMRLTDNFATPSFQRNSNFYPVSDTDWHSYLFSSDTNGGASFFYVDNVSIGMASEMSTGVFNCDIPTSFRDSAPTAINVCLSEIYITDEALDFSDSDVRAKFIDQTTLKPVFLGDQGQLPSGSPAVTYLSGNGAIFADNLGTVGPWTVVTGPLADCSTSPST